MESALGEMWLSDETSGLMEGIIRYSTPLCNRLAGAIYVYIV